jgi:alpha-beta hydrolase superfamily lysophospholipase
MWEGKVDATYVREWVSDNNKANIVIIHGVGEHSGRYIETAEKLFGLGFNVYTGDLIGHGLSDGYRIYIESVDDYMDNVNFFISRVKNDKPLFLLGHSMGGFIVLYYMLSNKDSNIRGAIVTSPYIKDKVHISLLKRILGKTASSIFPKLSIESGLIGEMVCRDKEIAWKYDHDPLNCSKVTARWFVELGKARINLLLQNENFDTPCLLLQAGGDVVVDEEAVQEFYDGISSQDKEFVLYNEFFHEILNDPERYKVIDKINAWLSERIE